MEKFIDESIMQSSTSLSSISSMTSSNSSIYGSQTILNAEDLPSLAPRCRSSIISSMANHSISCRHLFRTCLSSSSSSFSTFMQKKSADPIFQNQYFAKLSRTQPLLLVLDDYQCPCGCHFSVRQGTFVLLYERKLPEQFLTVISNQLICSKMPAYFLCDIEFIRERVRSRLLPCHNEQSFDL